MSACGCKNHMGTPKAQFPSWNKALDALFSRHIGRSAKGHSIYPCPRKSGVFHIRSGGRSKNPKGKRL